MRAEEVRKALTVLRNILATFPQAALCSEVIKHQGYVSTCTSHLSFDTSYFCRAFDTGTLITDLLIWSSAHNSDFQLFKDQKSELF